MDGLSGGRFLCDEVDNSVLMAQWVELPWLKDMGYYSLEAFVANRLEVALRLAWVSLQAGKKTKEKRAKEKAAEITGKAANVFWRMKGCVDWWVGLNPGTRKSIIFTFFGKATKALAKEIIKEESATLRNGFCSLDVGSNLPFEYNSMSLWQKANHDLVGKVLDYGLDFLPVAPSTIQNRLAMALSKLLVVHDVSDILLAWQLCKIEDEKLFFSSMASLLTVSDYILRKFQRLLMVVYAAYVNRELIEDSNLSVFPVKAERCNLICRSGKNKSHASKKSIAKRVGISSGSLGMSADFKLDSSSELGYQGTSSSSVVSGMPESVSILESTSVVEAVVAQNNMEKTRVAVDCKCKRKGRRKEAKNKYSDLKNFRKMKPIDKKDTFISIDAKNKSTETSGLPSILNSQLEIIDLSNSDIVVASSVSDVSQEFIVLDQLNEVIQEDHSLGFLGDGSSAPEECHPCYEKRSAVQKHDSCSLNKIEESQQVICPGSAYPNEQTDPPIETAGSNKLLPCDTHRKDDNETSRFASTSASRSFVPQGMLHTSLDGRSSVMHNDLPHNDLPCSLSNGVRECYVYGDTISMNGASYEWPSIAPFHLTSINSHLPATTDRLHLDVGHRWPYRLRQSLVPSKSHVGNSFGECGHSRILPSMSFPLSYDWPPMVRSSRPCQTLNVGYESAYSQSKPASLYSGLASCATRRAQVNTLSGDYDLKHAGEVVDVYDMKNISDFVEDTENYWLSEEEPEPHAISERDYNKFFGGGVMYWNPAEYVGTGFSRPPSHSSEDSSWAWQEADLNRTIDDMVGGKSVLPTYTTNGIASPPSSSYCSPFDSLASGHQSMGYVVAGNDAINNVIHSPSVPDFSDENVSSSSSAPVATAGEGVKGDQPPYPRLRPIIIPGMSRKGSRSDFKIGADRKSPCLPSTRRDAPQIKRPPSPVVLCVPRVPCPPPPSPIGESRKRGFPIVRSGSSSPRHWGVKSWCHEENGMADACLCFGGAEVVWPSWAAKGLGLTGVTQSLQGSLLQDHLITISQLAHEQEHPDVALPLQPPDLPTGSSKGSLSMMKGLLHEEIDCFCKQVAAENLIRKPYINWAVKRVTRSLQVLWPRSRTNIFGSNATGLALPTSDVDLVVSLPPVRNLEPIKEAGILEGRNGIKETCLQHAARYLANQDWVRNDSLKTVENTAIPVIMLVAEVPCDMILSNESSSAVGIPDAELAKMSGKHCCHSHPNHSLERIFSLKSSMTRKDIPVDIKSIRLDISFKSTSHTGLQTSEFVRELSQQFPASVPLALVLKKFLADRSLDHSYSGGLSSHCLVLLITRFLQHEHHCGYSINQNLGSLLMDFFYFFGNVFDPRQMRVSIQGSGVYMKRERGLSIDPIHIDDPLFPSNNVGRNCFRIHQCIKAFADAYTTLENELSQISDKCGANSAPSFRLLRKIIPSIDCEDCLVCFFGHMVPSSCHVGKKVLFLEEFFHSWDPRGVPLLRTSADSEMPEMGYYPRGSMDVRSLLSFFEEAVLIRRAEGEWRRNVMCPSCILFL
ncbi:hypothetical protein HPP92_005330 [Vanilla planifolia]|uniref:Polymerase nucleotidyl transferase domain-containing protein n=1 Tax=Vanilla planifolia TaxID=51239 RepID=A0A835VAW3_VANPL|nr:hypothetical protein HPP92_005330 [Vanilla planifolia]